MYLSIFASQLGTKVYEGYAMDDDENLESGWEIDLVSDGNGSYKVLAEPFYTDPHTSARVNQQQRQEIIDQPWLTGEDLLRQVAEVRSFVGSEEGDKAVAEILRLLNATEEDIPAPDIAGFLAAIARGEQPETDREENQAFKAGLVEFDDQYILVLTESGRNVLNAR